MFFVGSTGKVVTCGASKQSTREIRIWDLKDPSKPLHTEPVDSAAGAMIPLWDPDTSVFYLCGKGDGIVRLYEYEEKAPFIYKLNDGFRSNIPGKGYCLVPKRGLDVMQHETARVLKVTNNAGVHPLRFHVPRKSDAFQEDIFPPTASAVPSHTFAEWMDGSSKDPVTVSLNPGADGGANGGSALAHSGANGAIANGGSKTNGAAKKIFKSSSMLSIELDEARKRIELLEAKLAENGIAF
jgi:coronin-1B/1C/6